MPRHVLVSKPSFIKRTISTITGIPGSVRDFFAPAQSPSRGNEVARRPKAIVRKIPLEYVNTGFKFGTRGNFEGPEYDLVEIAKAIDTESLLSRSVEKHKIMVLKEGWSLGGRNPQTVSRVHARLREMELATLIPTNQLLTGLVESLISYSNAFLVIARSEADHPRNLRRRKVMGKTLFPMVGVFPMDATSVSVKRDKYGNVERWLQDISGVGDREFPPYNVIHLHYKRRTGFAFGTPLWVPALDDIRALRRMEELAELITHKYAVPLLHYKVGTEANPAREFDDGTSEVDVVIAEIESMPIEGAFVTPERHSIDVIGIKGEVMDSKPILEYWKLRVLAGVNLSTVDVGQGDTANRGTATVMSQGIIDQAKQFQIAICDFLNLFLLDPLLEEMGVELTPDNRVFFVFPEIDTDRRQVVENHLTDMFLKNAITHLELRQGLGKEPLLDTDMNDTNLFKFEIPKIQAKGAVDLEIAQKRASQTSGSKSKPAGGNSVANKNKPANQFGVKAAKTRPKNDRLDKFFAPERYLALDEQPSISEYIRGVFDEIAKQSTDYSAVSSLLHHICENTVTILSRSDKESDQVTLTRICSVLDSVQPVVEVLVAPYLNDKAPEH